MRGSEYEMSRRWGKQEFAQVFTGLDIGMCPCQMLPCHSLKISVLVFYTGRNNILSPQLSPYSKLSDDSVGDL